MTRITLLTFLLIALNLNESQAQSYQSATLEYEGEIRTYEIYVPSIYDASTAVPLMFNFHGGNDSSAGQIAIADMSSLAETDNFILVYPQAIADPNDGGSLNWIHKDPSGIDDVFFIDALIDAVANDYEIDQERIYACGYSLGGEFTYEVGCRLNHRIAAIGVVARTMQNVTLDNCAPVHLTGVLSILGTDDTISNYEGVFFQGEQFYLSATETHAYWAEVNNCDSEPSAAQVPNTATNDGSTVERNTWSTAEGDAYVEELKINGGGHDWPGTFGNMDIDASEEIWRFVSGYNIDGLIDNQISSISESSASFDYSVFPNPVKDVLRIESSLTEEQDFRIYSTRGDLLLSGKVKSALQKIDFSAFPANIYILEIGNRAQKIVRTN